MCAHECLCVYVVLTESLPERNLEVSHMRGCWYRSGLPSGSSGSLLPCWSCCRGSWKPELLCSLMRPQPGDNGRKALCEEADEEKEKGKEEDCLPQPYRHSRIPRNPSKVTAREVVVCGGPWAGRWEEGRWRLKDSERGVRVDFLTYWLVFIVRACVIMWCKC